jgi:hypothetical protein
MARPTAAAVPASKVKIGEVYAINYGEDEKGNDKLVRFRVTAVVTRRESDYGNPHDYKSTVEGIVPAPDNNGKAVTITVEPDALLGLYTEHVELVAREKAEKAKREAEAEAQKAKTRQLFAALYDAIGLTPPAEDERGEYRAPFRLGYGFTDIAINASGVEPLLAFFERIKATA